MKSRSRSHKNEGIGLVSLGNGNINHFGKPQIQMLKKVIAHKCSE